jgi:Arc/MetJ-type ribon-helix-helix transcriptional regulator
MPKESTQYVTVSIPVAIADEIDRLIEQSGYWPSRSAFVREACLEKLFKERQRLEELIQFEQRYK